MNYIIKINVTCFLYSSNVTFENLKSHKRLSPVVPVIFLLDKAARAQSSRVEYACGSAANKTSVVAPACDPSYLGGRGRRMVSLRLAQVRLVRPYLKTKQKRRAWIIA
jgi:hypothetical protein